MDTFLVFPAFYPQPLVLHSFIPYQEPPDTFLLRVGNDGQDHQDIGPPRELQSEISLTRSPAWWWKAGDRVWSPGGPLPSPQTLGCNLGRPGSIVGNMSGNRCESLLQIQGSQVGSRPGPILSWRLWNNFYGHSPPFRWIIQEGLLSVTSQSMCTKSWLLELAQEKVWLGELTVLPWR